MWTTARESREGVPTIDDMRYDLAEQEAINMKTSEIISMLIDGFEGLDNADDEDVRSEWEMLFGE